MRRQTGAEARAFMERIFQDGRLYPRYILTISRHCPVSAKSAAVSPFMSFPFIWRSYKIYPAYAIQTPLRFGLVSAEKSARHLSAEAVFHVVFHLFGGEAASKQEHQLGYGRLGGEVVTRHHSGACKVKAGDIAERMHAAVVALGDVYNHHAALYSLFDGADKPRVVVVVARPECFEHNPFMREWQAYASPHSPECGEEVDVEHIGVHLVMHS